MPSTAAAAASGIAAVYSMPCSAGTRRVCLCLFTVTRLLNTPCFQPQLEHTARRKQPCPPTAHLVRLRIRALSKGCRCATDPRLAGALLPSGRLAPQLFSSAACWQ